MIQKVRDTFFFFLEKSYMLESDSGMVCLNLVGLPANPRKALE